MKLASVCTMDCPDSCSLEVEVLDGRVQKISNSNLNPTTAGYICSKVRDFTKRLYSPDRILYPMKRVGPKGEAKFERISWDEAVEMVSRRFAEIARQYGGEAILPYSYGGSNGILGQDTSDLAFFSKLGASRLDRVVCAAPTSAASSGMYGKMPGVAFEDYVHAKVIVIWGANPKASNIHLVPRLKKAKANGAKIVLIDPKLNFGEREYDLHLPIFPGTDIALALAMIRIWSHAGRIQQEFLKEYAVDSDVILSKAEEWTLDRAATVTRVPAKDIETLANWYADLAPALIRLGWGMERNINGGQAAAAILAMPALMGKFGVQGGGFTLSNSSAARVNDCEIVDSTSWNTRVINMNLLGKVLLEEQNPPVKALFVYNSNAVATTPNQNAVIKGMMREDLFTVVNEQIMTDTAKYADILLPAVTFLEQEEIKKGYGTYALQYLGPVIERCGEAIPNEELFARLGRAMGWDDLAFRMTTEDYLRRVAGAVKGLNTPVTIEQLREKKILLYDFPGPHPVQFKTVFPWNSDKKIHLAPSALGDNPYSFEEIESKYPLALISPATGKTISSTMGEYNLQELYVVLNPTDATQRKLDESRPVKVFNEYGEVHCRLRIQSDLREGVALMPKGAWCKASLNGNTANALAPDTLGTAGGACFNDSRVEIAQL